VRRISERVAIDPQPGTSIGRYTIVRLIARGGVGLVYLARQSVSNAAVVVKVLAANLVGDAETSARFDREAQRLRGMQHPNIVAMIDYGHANGLAYLVMEYLQGELLSAYCQRKGPLALGDFAPIAAQILKAVGYAHGQGLMHRDLKPSNIMLCTRKGRANFVKILDFGMAKLVEGERDITSEQIVGTANYLSPEQIKGEPVDARVDVYAIGIMFYALLAGRLPFQADNNAALLYKHVHEAPPPLADALPDEHDVPPGLIALVHRCLAKDPADRPADANAVVEALIGCVPAQLFHLPVADSSMATASSSYAMLPTELAPAVDEMSDQLTRPVQPVHGAQSGRPPTGQSQQVQRARTRNRIPVIRPSTGPLPIVPAEIPAGGGRLWLVLAGVVLLLLIGVGALVFSSGSRGKVATAAPSDLAERRLGARLDQVELDVLAGEFDRARTDLDLAQGEAAAFPRLRARAEGLRQRMTIAMTLVAAERLEKEGQIEAAVGAYQQVLHLEPSHAESRAAIARLRAPAAEPEPEPTPTPTVKPTRPVKPGERPVARPVDPVEVPTPDAKAPDTKTPDTKTPAKPEPDDGLLRPDAKAKDGPIFLPVGD